MDSGPGANAPFRNDGTGDLGLDPATPDQRPHPWRRKPKRPETRVARRARLDRAAGEAIERAAETNGDPVALMAAASGTDAKYYDPIIRQHTLFFSELRARFLMPEERQRLEREAHIAAVVAAEPGPVVWVRRQFNGNRRRAAYRIADVTGLHWSSRSGGKNLNANRPYLHGYVWCNAMIVGKVAHWCRHGPPPHHIKVCITQIDNKAIWPELERAAPPAPEVSSRSRRRRKPRARKRAARTATARSQAPSSSCQDEVHPTGAFRRKMQYNRARTSIPIAAAQTKNALLGRFSLREGDRRHTLARRRRGRALGQSFDRVSAACADRGEPRFAPVRAQPRRLCAHAVRRGDGAARRAHGRGHRRLRAAGHRP
jgi:hypothetical protein